ncbi:MAG: hypothetical protein O2897_01775 [bacterium]|nr:hypothetical protein [bacterium]
MQDIGGSFKNALQEVIDKDPKAAWSILELRAQALKRQLTKDGVQIDDARIYNPVSGDEGIEQILSHELPAEPSEQKAALEKRLSDIEQIEKDSNYSTFSDVANAVAQQDIPLDQFKPPAEAQSWTNWAANMAVNGTVAVGSAALNATTSAVKFAGEKTATALNAKAMEKAREYVQAAGEQVETLTQTSLLDKLNALGLKSSADTRIANDQWSFDNLRSTLETHEQRELLQKIDSALAANKSTEGEDIKSPRDIINKTIDAFKKTYPLDPEIADAIKKYQGEVGVIGGITALISPWITKSINERVAAAGQEGQFDHLLSLEGITKSTEAINTFASELKDGAPAHLTEAEIKQQFEGNVKQAVDKLAETIFPPSYNPITFLKRTLLKMTLKDYYIKGISEQMVGQGSTDVFLAPIASKINSLFKGTDLKNASAKDKAYSQLAFSKLLVNITEQLGKPTIATDPAVDKQHTEQVTANTKALIDKIDPSKAGFLDPNSWGATALKYGGESLGKSILYKGTGLADLIQGSHNSIVNEKLLPWLQGQ